MRKGQGLSLDTIIIAAIVLIVLIVLWAIFTGRMGVFAQGLAKAESNCKDVCTAIGKEGGLSTDDKCTEAQGGLVRTINTKEGVKACCCI